MPPEPRQVTSALYYLVWGLGMGLKRAEATLALSPELVPDLARAGSLHWKGCEFALWDVNAASSTTTKGC